MKLLSAGLLFCAVVASSGCGGGGGTLHGTVKFKKVPLAFGQVRAVNGEGQSAVGDIQADGTYRIENCPGGTVKISVTSPDPQVRADAEAAAASDTIRRGRTKSPTMTTTAPATVGDPSKWFAIPEQYNNPDTSGLTATVSGKTEYNIDME